MKTIISCVVALVVTTILFGQALNRDDSKLATTIEYVRKESLGGKLDFRSVLKEPDQVVYYRGVGFNRKDYHVFLWGQAVGDLGLSSSDTAARLWEEIYKQKLTNPQRTALRIGFNNEIK